MTPPTLWRTARHAVGLLGQRGSPRGAANQAAYPYLLFPMTLRALRGDCSAESVRIYWQGVRLAFPSFSAQLGARYSLEILKDVSPLAGKVPRAFTPVYKLSFQIREFWPRSRKVAARLEPSDR